MFKVVKYDVDTNGSALSYAQVCQKIRKAINVESLENGYMRLSSRKRRAPDDMMSTGSLHVMNSMPTLHSVQYLAAAFPPTSCVMKQQWGLQQVSAMQVPSSPAEQTMTSARDRGSCGNCHDSGHIASDCPSLTCGHCGIRYPNQDVIGFHNSSNCPSRSARSAHSKTPFVRGGAAGHGPPAVNAVRAESNEWDEDVEPYWSQNQFVGMMMTGGGSVLDDVVFD
jgi:hypothetical protein